MADDRAPLAELLDLERDPASTRAQTARTTPSAQCGEALVGVGAVEPAYVEAMLERERSDLDVRRRGRRHPARHAGRQGARCAATRCCFLRFPTASTGTATQVDRVRRHRRGRRRPRRVLAQLAADPDRPRPGAAHCASATDPKTCCACCSRPRKRHDVTAREGRPVLRARRHPGRGRPRAVAGPGDVKIRVRNCSTCGTDVKISRFGHHHIVPAAGDGPRDRRRGRRGRRRRRRAGRRATGSRSSRRSPAARAPSAGAAA